MARKRSRPDEVLLLKLSDGSLEADAGVVRRASKVADSLPADAAVWDLSGLTLDGQTYDKPTVVQWLNLAYKVFSDSDGDEDAYDASTGADHSATGMYKLLAFADAVMSRRGVLTVCMEQIRDLCVEVQHSEKWTRLPVASGGVYTFDGHFDGVDIVCACAGWDIPVWRALEESQLDSLLQQVTTQTEALRYMAHKLRLRPLIEALHGFLFRCCTGKYGMLHGRMGRVFTDRVVDAALGNSTVTKADWMGSILTKPITTAGFHPWVHEVLSPTGEVTFCSATKTLQFDAQLHENFAGGRKGDVVSVCIDLFAEETGNATITLGKLTLPVKLCIGCPVSDSNVAKVLG